MFFAWFFYRSALAVPFLLLLVPPLSRRLEDGRRERSRVRLREEFKEALGSMVTALRAGFSAENAVKETCMEMELLYGRESEICREFSLMIRGMGAGMPLEQMMCDFGERSGIADVKEFAQTFVIARRSGGNMVEIMSRTVSLLQDRMEAEQEIGLSIAARRMEQRIMNVVPFLIVLYIELTSENFFAPLYHNPFGVIVMTVCLLLYLAAFAAAEKIVRIRV